jgi:hypothetical protein
MSKIKDAGNVNLPIMSTQELVVPEFFANRNVLKSGKIKWKLVNPLTKTRNLSKRKGDASVKIIRKPVEHMVLMSHSTTPIPINLFSKKDRDIINHHFKVVETHKDKDIKEVPVSPPFQNKERGRPEKLPANIAINKERRAEAKNASKKPTKKLTAPAPAPEPEPAPAPAQNITMNIEEVVPAGKRKNKKYANDEERKEAIRQQKRESAKRIRDAKKKTKDEVGTGLNDYLNVVMNGRKDYPPQVRNILSKVGDRRISGIELRRTPLSFLLDKALNAISLGQFEKNKPYDKLYHLAMVCSLDDGHRLLIEKNAVIHFQMSPPSPAKDTETMNIAVNKDLKVGEMMKNTQIRMGDNFFTYDADTNNCQQFIVNILRANGLNTPDAEKFVFQDLKTLFNRLPVFTKPIIDATTNLGAKVDEIAFGAGLKGSYSSSDSDSDVEDKDYVVQSVIFDSSKYSIASARKWLRENNYKSPKVDVEQNTLRFRQIDPKKVEKDGYTKYRNTKLGRSGITLVLVYNVKGGAIIFFGRDITQGEGIKNISSNSIMPKFAKGSKEAKEHMARIRAMRGNGLKEDAKDTFDKARSYLGFGLKEDAMDTFDKARSYLGLGVAPPSRSYSGTPNPMGYGIHHHHHHHYHMGGGDIWDDIGDAFNPDKNGLTQSVNNSTNTIKSSFEPGGDANQFFTRQLPSTLIHQGIPAVAGVLGGLAGEALVPEGGPVSGFVGNQIGKQFGKMGADELGRQTGYGFKKGSKEAKEHMARIRAMRGKGMGGRVVGKVY